MNANTKYYTPEFHEFHEGFEYEDGFTFADFSRRMFSYNEIGRMDRSLFLKALDNKQIRVKCLDREDIESLGWIQRDYDTFDFGSNIAFEFIPEETSYIYTYGGGKNSDTIFKGKIKNKSELQRLMVQLKIKHENSN